MKRIFVYLSVLLLGVGFFSSCNEEFDTPPMVVGIISTPFGAFGAS